MKCIIIAFYDEGAGLEFVYVGNVRLVGCAKHER